MLKFENTFTIGTRCVFETQPGIYFSHSRMLTSETGTQSCYMRGTNWDWGLRLLSLENSTFLHTFQRHASKVDLTPKTAPRCERVCLTIFCIIWVMNWQTDMQLPFLQQHSSAKRTSLSLRYRACEQSAGVNDARTPPMLQRRLMRAYHSVKLQQMEIIFSRQHKY